MTFKLFLIIFTIHNSVLLQASENTLPHELFTILEEKSLKKWSKFLELQQNDVEISKLIQEERTGVIYRRGLLGTTVRRSINALEEDKWIVEDVIDLGEGGFIKAFNIAALIAIPFVKPSVLRQRTFINYRVFDSYSDAILSDVFTGDRIPLSYENLDQLDINESISLVYNNGFQIRGIAHFFSLLGIEVPISLGEVKFSVSEPVRLMLTKTESDTVELMIELAKKKSSGASEGIEVSVADYIKAPINIGINSPDGFGPIRLLQKESRKSYKQVFYKIELNNQIAVDGLIGLFKEGDLSMIDDLVTSNDVSIDLIRHGKEKLKKRGWLLDLFLIKNGKKHIRLETDVESISGEVINNYGEYKEITIRDKKRFARKEHFKHQTYSQFPNAYTERFYLDYEFFYQGENLKGKSLNRVFNPIMDLLDNNHLFPSYDKKFKVPFAQAILKIRFTQNVIEDILNATDLQVWRAMGESLDLADPRIFANKSVNRKLRLKNIDERWKGFRKSCQTMMRTCYRKSRKIVRKFIQVRDLNDTRETVKGLSKQIHKYIKRDNMFLKLLVNLANRNELLIQGKVFGNI